MGGSSSRAVVRTESTIYDTPCNCAECVAEMQRLLAAFRAGRPAPVATKEMEAQVRSPKLVAAGAVRRACTIKSLDVNVSVVSMAPDLELQKRLLPTPAAARDVDVEKAPPGGCAACAVVVLVRMGSNMYCCGA
jgi:hypothetical protein